MLCLFENPAANCNVLINCIVILLYADEEKLKQQVFIRLAKLRIKRFVGEPFRIIL